MNTIEILAFEILLTSPFAKILETFVHVRTAYAGQMIIPMQLIIIIIDIILSIHRENDLIDPGLSPASSHLSEIPEVLPIKAKQMIALLDQKKNII
ncbi:hypothetical protein ACJX0J_040720, partial [Zea mays]